MALLADLIDLPARPLISIVGAGGKTTTMYTLARDLAARGKRVITTTTTNIYLPRQDETDTLIVSPDPPRLLKMINSAWKQHQCITVAGGVLSAGKLAGLAPWQPYELLTRGGAEVVIVEADGARHHMLKAPAEHEPALPPQSDVVLLMMSAEALNQPLDPAIVHRPERVAALLGIELGDLLSPNLVVRLLLSEQGGMKNVPVKAKVYLLLTHVTGARCGPVREVAALVCASSRAAAVLASAEPGAWEMLHGSSSLL